MSASPFRAGGALRVTGLTELLTVYRTLPDTLKRKLLRRAVRQAGNVVRTEARTRAPQYRGPFRKNKQPGTLRRSLIVKSARELNTATQVGVVVTARRGKAFQKTGKKGINKDAFYARWVHDGHRIVARGKGAATRGRVSGIAARRRAAGGSTVAGNPFLNSALEASAGRALDRFADILRADLAKPDLIK